MTKEGWAQVVVHAVNVPAALDALAEHLAEVDAAQDVLRRKGYGAASTAWAALVAEVPAK